MPVVFENPHRPPLTGQNDLRQAVTIKIAKDRAADQADSLEGPAVLGIVNESPAFVPEQPCRDALGVTSAHEPAPNQQIQVAIAIDVRQRQRPHADTIAGDPFASPQVSMLEIIS